MVVVQLSAAMSILNYFKPKDGLPDPKGPLSQSLSSQAITATNVPKKFKRKSRFARSNLEQPLLYENLPIRNFNIRKLLHAKISQTTVYSRF